MNIERITILLGVVLFSGHALAQNAVLDHQGYAWESGGFPTSVAGDSLHMVGVITSLDSRFNVDPSNAAVTFWTTDLVSAGQVDLGGGIVSIAYSGGTLEVWFDPTPDHDYGINPANATSPSTFRDGTLLLGGTLHDFYLYFDTVTGVGAYEAQCDFDSGIGLAALNQFPGAAGFTFGGVLSPAAAGGNVPQGYDLQTDGVIEVTVIVGVESRSWSAIKQMYQD